MKEIGSEFWNVPIRDIDNDFFSSTIDWYVSGRSALKAIIYELKETKSVALPSWCCDSIIETFLQAGKDVMFYPVYCKNGALFQDIRFDCDILFIMDFFGYIDKQYTGFETIYKGIVIRDVTHSIFSKSYQDADYYFGSMRKWCGMWTGGYAWSRDGHHLVNYNFSVEAYIELRNSAMKLKESYINGMIANKQNNEVKSTFLSYFRKAEEYLDSFDIVSAEKRDIELARKLDIDLIKRRHKSNAKVLINEFEEWTVFPNLSEYDCPMFVPIIIPDQKRDKLQSYLIRKGIYCPIHWPISQYHRLNSLTRYLYDNEISLVCDHRYSEKDMYTIIESIRLFWKE